MFWTTVIVFGEDGFIKGCEVKWKIWMGAIKVAVHGGYDNAKLCAFGWWRKGYSVLGGLTYFLILCFTGRCLYLATWTASQQSFVYVPHNTRFDFAALLPMGLSENRMSKSVLLFQ